MSGRLILFSGPAAAGKTRLASELAQSLGAHHLQMDATRARLMPDSPHTRGDRAIAYRAMHFAAELLLRSGQTVILDAQYGHSEDQDEVRRIVERTGAIFRLIECKVAPDVAVKRFRERPHDHPGLDLTEERVHEMAQAFPYSGKGLVIDTGELRPDRCLREIDEYVRTCHETR